MRIRLMLPVAISVVGALALVSSGFIAAQAWQHRQAAIEGLRNIDAFASVLKAWDRQALERRALLRSVWGLSQPPGVIADAIRATDEAFEVSASTLAARPATAGLAPLMLMARAALAEPRQRILAALAEQNAETAARAALPMINDFVAVASSTFPAAAAAQGAAGRADPTVAPILLAVRIAAAMRETAGVRGAILMHHLRDPPAPLQEIVEATELTGQIVSDWNGIEDTAAALEDRPRLAALIATTRQTFMVDGERMNRSLLNGARTAIASGTSGAVVLTPADFRAFTEPMLDQLALLRDTGLQEAVDAGHAHAAHATRAVALALATAALVLIVVGWCSWFVTRRVAVPLGRLAGEVARLSVGRLDERISGAGGDDEIGTVAGAVEGLRINSIEARALSAAISAEQAERAASGERLRALVQAFEGHVANTVGTLAGTAADLRTTADKLADGVQIVAREADRAAGNARETADDVSIVTDACSQISESIVLIANRALNSSDTIQQIAVQARATDMTLVELAAAAARISRVVQLISDIADKTNLLALNATIEASRAGDAGRGFAVVASEVKALAAETARATEDIAQQAADMRGTADSAIAAVQAITAQVGQISAGTDILTKAMAEQRVCASEVARAARRAAEGTFATSSATAVARQGSHDAQDATAQVAEQADAMQNEVGRLTGHIDEFLRGVRAA